MEKDKKKREYLEDVTKYGEFISTYFGWTSLEGQKDKVEKLQNMTNDEKKRNNEKRREK